MMNTYRPDLASRLSTAQLLDLRYDPTISREMVRNLAREGEAYLKARGQTVTAGRLYLCHFLGMEGAGRVLAAPGDAQLVAVLGPGRDQSPTRSWPESRPAYVIDWAERKMGNRAANIASAAAAVVRQVKRDLAGIPALQEGYRCHRRFRRGTRKAARRGRACLQPGRVRDPARPVAELRPGCALTR